tara:strand:+ start:4319 stop:4564 length:246 start_codon:yes stop_codon:yes gene_type:complete
MWAGALSKASNYGVQIPIRALYQKNMDYIMKAEVLNPEKITRLEIIDESGRAYVSRDIAGLEVHLQDDGRTLKLFISKHNN